MAMASTFISPQLAPGLHLPRSPASFTVKPRGTNRFCVRASEKEIEFGARDPFPQELESNFCSKVLGNASTEHIILVPSMPLAIAEKSCYKLPPGTSAMSEDDAKALLRKVVGWRIVTEDGCMKLQGEWNVKSFSAGVELLSRVAAVAETENYFPSVSLDQSNRARVNIWTESVDGLTENDFILAAKIDKVKTSDLIKRNRFWA